MSKIYRMIPSTLLPHTFKFNYSHIRFLYNLFFPFVLLAFLPKFLVRMLRRGNYQHKFGQRFALYSAYTQAQLASKSWIWVHAVSVGEVLIALKLIERIKAETPAQQFVLSTTTSTAFTLANQQNNKGTHIEVIYNPIDFFWTAERAIQLIRPKQLILVEAEVWPNLVWKAKQIGASVVLVNARLSPRSERRYRRFRTFMGPIFRALDAICVQEPSDIERWIELGARPEQLHLTGSIKFDDAKGENSSAAQQQQRDFRPLLCSALGCPPDAKILLAGSTHAGEEKILGKIFLSLRKAIPHLFLLIAPRHVERSQEVLADLRDCGLHAILRSDTEKTPSTSSSSSKARRGDGIMVIDSTGELKDWYRCADAVFIGKSLTSYGGQNPAEAIVAEKPVTFGPHMENFQALTDMLLSAHGAIISHDEKELEKNLLRMLSDTQWTASLCENAANCLARHRGATLRTVQILRNFL